MPKSLRKPAPRLGRPPLKPGQHRVKIHASVDPETNTKLVGMMAEQRMSMGKAMDLMVRLATGAGGVTR